MNLIAAVMTGKGSGAIAAIQLFGCQASEILEEIFIPSKKSQAAFTIGNIILGTINTNSNVIDQVLLGCEGKDIFTINCHGNPLIVSDILKILEEKGVKIVSAEYLLAQIYSKKTEINSIALEAKLAMAKAATLDGTRIIAHQIKNGLLETIKKWHKENIAHEKIREEAKKILQDSKKAKFLIYGCKIVLAGPPNSGKSTLFNCLTGKEKTIVTDIKGTTRDWVSANCQIGKLSAELFDTAGLDENISAEQIAEKQAQQKSYEILEQADLVLLVLDAGNRTPLITKQFLKRIKDKAVLSVFNKCDLDVKIDKTALPFFLNDIIEISAKNNIGIENLIKKIQQICGIEQSDLSKAICFTPRQENLLQKISESNSDETILAAITELLNGSA